MTRRGFGVIWTPSIVGEGGEVDSGVRRISTGRGMGVLMLLAFFISICIDDSKDIPLSNAVVAETARGYPVDEEARKGNILRIHRGSKIDRERLGKGGGGRGTGYRQSQHLILIIWA